MDFYMLLSMTQSDPSEYSTTQDTSPGQQKQHNSRHAGFKLNNFTRNDSAGPYVDVVEFFLASLGVLLDLALSVVLVQNRITHIFTFSC